MNAILDFVNAWPGLISKAFTEHSLVAAVLTIGAIGIFVILQRDLRPYNLVANLVFVALGWLAAISLVAPAMAALRDAWGTMRESVPFAATLLSYLYGIGERHPLLALIIVAAGTTLYFLKGLWPREISWPPVRAVCAAFGIALLVHIAGPIADLAAGAPPRPVAQPGAMALPELSARDAVDRAVKAGDLRYVSVQRCIDEVLGITSPSASGVKSIGPKCHDSLGKEGEERARSLQAYAAEYNKLMYEHNAALRMSLKGG
jgi:hypothetical protein